MIQWLIDITNSLKSLVLMLLLVGGNTLAESPRDIVGATTVDLVEARQLHQQGAVFIDVRDHAAFSLGHIPGAVHLDFNDDAFVVLYVSDALDRDTPIVFYCDSALASSGAMASFFAANWGYKNVYFFRDGYYSWMASDFPIQYQIAQQAQSEDLAASP
jgi:rhodanese-related sulfurtransferase